MIWAEEPPPAPCGSGEVIYAGQGLAAPSCCDLAGSCGHRSLLIGRVVQWVAQGHPSGAELSLYLHNPLWLFPPTMTSSPSGMAFLCIDCN